MPILLSAKKNLRKSARRRIMNDKRRRTMREQIKSITLIKDARTAKENFPRVMQAIDKAAKMGVIKKHTASRKKSRISAMIKKLG
ncbi:hypothetical protein A2997_00450 [Candidatus Nomurabacteria bacterium RIFCSPLOWO2_01_FULL_36_10b]|uniref:Small ribosomal subunit protein bS20 n=1 Tax=Candidatus Nomurabacteria bacterium RIFCSPLOWO2_01_FULL_36_10b TaxID=1801766 RepID=A0A1F6WPR4_9BACT|nr:MAG: hypothetical protein A2997_00450 [Candidatus Nomurabacteria bacterium RIFCSPLOWO2_01_FULL_36_10b]